MPFQGVSFDDDRQRNASIAITEAQTISGGGMIGWLLRHRIVSNEEQAKTVILIATVVIFILAGVVFWINSGIGNIFQNEEVDFPIAISSLITT